MIDQQSCKNTIINQKFLSIQTPRTKVLFSPTKYKYKNLQLTNINRKIQSFKAKVATNLNLFLRKILIL
jgi:hypothetical protein